MLEVNGLSVSYGPHRALEGVSLKVSKGEICVILGANGAGKSTLLKAIAGMTGAEAGSISMNGRSISRLKAHRIVEEGIALVPEGRGIFGDLTVAENLRLGAFARRARSAEQTTLAGIYALFPRLSERKAQIARTMSGGEQQMVAIGRALMSRPEILMLDEPSLGLSPLLTQELFRSLSDIAATGVGILLVEQNARQSLRIAGRGYLIENGHVTGENSAKALADDPAVIAAYLGGSAGGHRSGQTAQPSFSLPRGIALPSTAGAIARSINEVALRAGSIQRAFIGSMRRGGTVPSAFVGRYDPRAGSDPWAELDVPAQSPASSRDQSARTIARDAAREAGRAVQLAQRATDRLARHIETARLSAPLPSAFQNRAAHGTAPEGQAEPVHDFKPDRSHGLIGHNSVGSDIESEPLSPIRPPVAASTVQRSQRAPTIAELAARAAAIQAAHVADRRRRLGTFTVPAARTPPPAANTSDGRPDGTAAPTAQAQAPDRIETPVNELVARATAIHAAHVAERRRRTNPVMAAGLGGPGSAIADEQTVRSAGRRKKKKRKES